MIYNSTVIISLYHSGRKEQASPFHFVLRNGMGGLSFRWLLPPLKIFNLQITEYLVIGFGPTHSRQQTPSIPLSLIFYFILTTSSHHTMLPLIQNQISLLFSYFFSSTPRRRIACQFNSLVELDWLGCSLEWVMGAARHSQQAIQLFSLSLIKQSMNQQEKRNINWLKGRLVSSFLFNWIKAEQAKELMNE